MNDAMMMFREGGWSMYAITATGFFAWVFAAATLVALLFKRTPLMLGIPGLLAVVFGGVTVLIGLGGYFMGMSAMESALAYADPEHIELMRAEGARMAKYPLYYGLIAGGIPLLDGLFGIVLGISARKGTAE